MNAALLEGHGPLVSLTMSRKRFDAFRSACETSLGIFPLHAVAIRIAQVMSDDRYLEAYADGASRLVIEEAPPVLPTINIDAPLEVPTYSGEFKPRPRHQRPLRNIRRSAK